MRALSLFTCILLGACADDPEPPSPDDFQQKLASRPDQTGLSSDAPCYCFPDGPTCGSPPYYTIPPDAPDDVPACGEGEACYGDPIRYQYDFDAPRGRCRRSCFHAYARLPSYALGPTVKATFDLDCADGEVCARWQLGGFEGVGHGSAGFCIPEPRAQ